MTNNFQVPTQLIKMLKNGNPQQILGDMLQQNSQNPMLQNVMSLMNSKDSRGIETIARNLCKSRGLDADAMFKEIQQNFQ